MKALPPPYQSALRYYLALHLAQAVVLTLIGMLVEGWAGAKVGLWWLAISIALAVVVLPVFARAIRKGSTQLMYFAFLEWLVFTGFFLVGLTLNFIQGAPANGCITGYSVVGFFFIIAPLVMVPFLWLSAAIVQPFLSKRQLKVN